MIDDRTMQTIEGLSDIEIRESIVLKESDFQPGVYQLYLVEAKKRNIDTEAEIRKEVQKSRFRSAPISKRLANYLVDTIIGIGLGYLIVLVPVQSALLSPIFALFGILGVYILYYIFAEARYGKTVGKFLTRTTVVTDVGGRPGISDIVRRTLSRIVPLNSWITLFTGYSLHERFSNTVTVEDKTIRSHKILDGQ